MPKQFPKIARIILGLVAITTLTACDPEGRKECAWTLEPEPKLQGTTDEGMIPLCARNRKTMKQDCRFQAPLAYAEKVFGRTFRYVDVDVVSSALPRTITTIKFCDGKGDQ